MLTLTAFSPAPVEVIEVRPGQHRPRPAPDLGRSLQDRQLAADQGDLFSRNPDWDASTDPVRKAYVDKVVVNETASRSHQQQLQTGTPSADMAWDNFPPPSQIPRPGREEGPQPQHR